MLKTIKLPCGVPVVMEKSDYARSAAICVAVKAGYVDENDDVLGISHLVEHMLFRSTKNRSTRKLLIEEAKTGSFFEGFTEQELTRYSIQTLPSHIYTAVELLADMITSPNFDEDEINKEKGIICRELDCNKDTWDKPHELSSICRMAVLFETSFRNIDIDTRSLPKISRATLLDYYKEKYVRENIAIAVVGNFDEDKIISLLENSFACLPVGEKCKRSKIETSSYEPLFFVDKQDVTQTYLRMATLGMSLSDPHYYAFRIMSEIFGGSWYSRLKQSLRENKALAYSIYSENCYYSQCGVFSIYMAIAQGKEKDAIDAVRHEMENLIENGITNEELCIAKEQLKSSYAFSLEDLRKRASNLGRYQLLLDEVYEPDEVIRGYDAVSVADVIEAAKRVGDLSSYCAVADSPEKFDLEAMMKG